MLTTSGDLGERGGAKSTINTGSCFIEGVNGLHVVIIAALVCNHR